MRDNHTTKSETTPGSVAGGGAAVGAGFGALAGAVAGWLLGAQVPVLPTIGPVVGQWALPGTLVGLLAGVAIGALIGALAAVTSFGAGAAIPASDQPAIGRRTEEQGLRTEYEVPSTDPAATQSSVLVPQSSVRQEPVEAESRADASEDSIAAIIYDDNGTLGNEGIFRASSLAEAETGEDAIDNQMEATSMDTHDEQKGRNPNAFTGTEDAVDPETGAIGTAGTPVTTGYGVSGSTIGTGSRRRQEVQEDEDFRGATPDTISYDVGGRGTGDTGALQGGEQEASVVDRNSDADREEASVPRSQEGKDIYEQSTGYAESLDRVTRTED